MFLMEKWPSENSLRTRCPQHHRPSPLSWSIAMADEERTRYNYSSQSPVKDMGDISLHRGINFPVKKSPDLHIYSLMHQSLRSSPTYSCIFILGKLLMGLRSFIFKDFNICRFYICLTNLLYFFYPVLQAWTFSSNMKIFTLSNPPYPSPITELLILCITEFFPSLLPYLLF